MRLGTTALFVRVQTKLAYKILCEAWLRSALPQPSPPGLRVCSSDSNMAGGRQTRQSSRVAHSDLPNAAAPSSTPGDTPPELPSAALATTSTKPPPKRKRAATTSKPNKPPAKRPAVSEAPPPVPIDNIPLVVHPDDESHRAYTTRPSNDPHPAKSVGLEKRSQTEVAAAASAKRAVKQAKADSKEADHRQKQIEEAAAINAVAESLDKYRQLQMLADTDLNNNFSQVALHNTPIDPYLLGPAGQPGSLLQSQIDTHHGNRPGEVIDGVVEGGNSSGVRGRKKPGNALSESTTHAPKTAVSTLINRCH